MGNPEKITEKKTRKSKFNFLQLKKNVTRISFSGLAQLFILLVGSPVKNSILNRKSASGTCLRKHAWRRGFSSKSGQGFDRRISKPVQILSQKTCLWACFCRQVAEARIDNIKVDFFQAFPKSIIILLL